MQDMFVEVIGTVEDANVVKMQACINLGSELGEPSCGSTVIKDSLTEM